MIKNEKVDTTELTNTSLEFVELSLDSILKDGVAKDLPIVNSVLAIFKTTKNITEYYAQKKLVEFLNAADTLSSEEIGTYTSKFKDDKEIGTRILLLINKADTYKKASLMGRCLKLLALDFDSESYLRLCSMIERTFYEDITFLAYFNTKDTSITSKNDNIPTIVLESLFANGFISEFGFDGGDASGNTGGTIYRLNRFGIALKSVLLTRD